MKVLTLFGSESAVEGDRIPLLETGAYSQEFVFFWGGI